MVSFCSRGVSRPAWCRPAAAGVLAVLTSNKVSVCQWHIRHVVAAVSNRNFYARFWCQADCPGCRSEEKKSESRVSRKWAVTADLSGCGGNPRSKLQPCAWIQSPTPSITLSILLHREENLRLTNTEGNNEDNWWLEPDIWWPHGPTSSCRPDMHRGSVS